MWIIFVSWLEYNWLKFLYYTNKKEFAAIVGSICKGLSLLSIHW